MKHNTASKIINFNLERIPLSTIEGCDLADEELWDYCLSGDLHSFESLYKKYYNALFSYSFILYKNSDLAKDCIQNIFLKLIQNHSKLPKVHSVKSYLFKMIRNNIIDSKRKLNRELSLEDISIEHLDVYPSGVSKLDLDVLGKAYKSLNNRQREVIYLFYFKELKHSEIAVVLNLTVQSSKNLLYLAMIEFKQAFHQLNG